MTLINVIANKEVVEDLLVRDILTVENRVDCSNLTISDNITLAPGATFVGNFIKDFEETDTYLDENNVEITTTETIDLYEKIERIDSKIDANTTSHANNAAAIGSRYTKTAADLRFVSNTDARVTGDLNLRPTETEPYVSLTTKLGEKVSSSTLDAYILANDETTKENADAIERNTEAIQTKEDIEALKVMIRMLAYGVQPNFIVVNTENRRVKFAKNIYTTDYTDTAWYLLSFNSGVFETTEAFLTALYTALGTFFVSRLDNVVQAFTDETGTNNDGTGGFFFKLKVSSGFLPSDIEEYKLFFEDDYVCNKAGYLSMPQILRTGSPISNYEFLSYTRVDDVTYTISAAYPNFVI